MACGRCRQPGHNIRTCERRQAEAEAELLEAEEARRRGEEPFCWYKPCDEEVCRDEPIHTLLWCPNTRYRRDPKYARPKLKSQAREAPRRSYARYKTSFNYTAWAEVQAQEAHARSAKLEKAMLLKEHGVTFYRFSRFNEAVTKYTEALMILGKDASDHEVSSLRCALLSNRAIAFWDGKRLERAIEDADAALKLNPDKVNALLIRARYNFHKRQNYKAIQADCLRAIRAAGISSSTESVRKELRRLLQRTEELLSPPAPLEDLYATLGLAVTNPSTAMIKRAYRNLALKIHPDKGGDTAKFQELQAAYEILMKRHSDNKRT